jgi:hypothetical protein
MEDTSITTKYVRKPLYVDAVQVTEENFADVARWCFGKIHNIDESEATAVEPSKQFIEVQVNNPKTIRQRRAFLGDWILYTEKGYKVYTTKAFTANFDKVEEAQPVTT